MLLTKRWRRSNRANQRHINNIYFYLKVITMKNENIPYKIYLNESEMPKAWYNLRADMKQRPEPVNGVLPFPWLVPTLTLTVKYIW